MQNDKEKNTSIMSDRKPCDLEDASPNDVIIFKKRMLKWPNPVEYVNNMYGCHPDNNDNEYFKVIFTK
jgi:hypothetical protein